MVLTYHNPIELAKYSATLDQLSGGRFILGVGAGGTREESDALGLDFHHRGTIANEMMRVMRELWALAVPDRHPSIPHNFSIARRATTAG